MAQGAGGRKMELYIIVLLVGIVMGLMVGVSLSRPNLVR
jgi:hypothetical protein